MLLFFFFFNDTATTEIYTLSLHDALPIFPTQVVVRRRHPRAHHWPHRGSPVPDRKSTRLNSSHLVISYAVFCLKKKKRGVAVWAGGVPDRCPSCRRRHIP